MFFVVKRLFKINVSLKTSVLIFFPMRVRPVRVTISNERAVAQVTASVLFTIFMLTYVSLNCKCEHVLKHWPLLC